MAIHLASDTRNAMADAVDAEIGASGKLIIYTGSQHATPGTLPSGTALATFSLANPAFAAASGGSIALTAPATVQGDATGTAGCFVVTDGTNVVFDGSVTATGGGGDLTLNTTSITTGVDVDITSGTFTIPDGT